MEKKDYIIELIKLWPDSEIADAWNTRCSDCGYDDYIEFMDNFNDRFAGMEPTKLALMVSCGEFSIYDMYYSLDGYGNINTYFAVDDPRSPLDYGELADYLMEYGDANTAEIDTDRLQEYFLDWFKGYLDSDLDKARDIIENKEDYDFLSEDWSDIASAILNYEEE